ncbi:MAG: nucleotide sugar dehydrogenase, partial [Vicinamibacterales bacterium]
DAINSSRSYIPDVPEAELAQAVAARRLRASADMNALGTMDVIDICVPTPLRKTKDPDLSYVVKAVEAVVATLRPGQLVVLESTTYPGTTDEVVQPMLEERGLVADRDFFLAFSPERVDPGNAHHTTRTIPKVVGGVGPASTAAAAELYASFLDRVIPVSSTRVAEMVKLLENTFRAVNIGLVNEIALLCHRMNIGVWEVIDAAGTKPFGFMPFYPGPGLGGHCIPIDPFYLSWRARQDGFECRFIELAGQINGAMPRYVVARLADGLNAVRKPLNGSRIHLFGLAYKKNVGDVRESPALDIVELLLQAGATVSYTDPYVADVDHGGHAMVGVPFDEAVKGTYDCAVITTDHDAFDYARIADMPLVLDTRNALKNFTRPSVLRL